MRSHSFGSQIFKLFNSKNAYNRLKQTYFRPRFLDGLRFFILFNYMSSCFQLNVVNDFRVVFNLLSFVLSEVHVLLMLFVFINVYWCSSRFPYQMMYNSQLYCECHQWSSKWLPFRRTRVHLCFPQIVVFACVFLPFLFYSLYCLSFTVLVHPFIHCIVCLLRL